MSTHSICFRIKRDLELYQLYYNICIYGKILGLKNEFELAVINEPPVFEP